MNPTALTCRRALCAALAGAFALALLACEQKPSTTAKAERADARAANEQTAGLPPEAAGTVREQSRPQPPAPEALAAQARSQTDGAPASPPQAADTPEPKEALPKASPAAGKPAPAGRPLTDDELAARVKAAVLAEPLSALMFNVNVSNGVVTLSGTADTPATRDKAARAASGVEGVKSVNNKIAIMTGS